MRSWPHAPSRQVNQPGTYIITSATNYKLRLFDTEEKLSLLETGLLEILKRENWSVQAWAVMSNHYHFVAVSCEGSADIRKLIKAIHGRTAVEINRLDGVSNRQVWYRYWDTCLSFEKSYLARLAYVHQNPVKHGLVKDARDYPWCSSSWFFNTADPAFRESVMSFPIDRVNVIDDF